ncbi:glycosyltransferase [Limosilactobacillus sp.]|uniref:glycosyltransferase n=1 Tax=Limosilactobacillus sp. TaxID=2773925 RepID=UPI00345F0E49
MDVLVLPSLCHETFGFVVLEALLQGTPCLVSNTVGAKDIVPENFIFNNERELFTKLKTFKIQRTLDMFKNQTNRLHLDFDMHNHAIEIKRTFYEY